MIAMNSLPDGMDLCDSRSFHSMFKKTFGVTPAARRNKGNQSRELWQGVDSMRLNCKSKPTIYYSFLCNNNHTSKYRA